MTSKVTVVAVLLLALAAGCDKSTSGDAKEADKRLDLALARKNYGGLMLYLKDHPGSPRAAEARKAADALAARAIQGYVSAAKTAPGAAAVKAALQWLHENGGRSLLFTSEHLFPASIRHDATGTLKGQLEHDKQLGFDRQREIAGRLSSVLGHHTMGAFSVFNSSVFVKQATTPTLALQTTLAEAEKPMVTNKGSFSKLEMKISLRLLLPGKEPQSIIDEVAQLPEGFRIDYKVQLRPGETLDQKDPAHLVYTTMRKRLWDSVSSRVYDALALGSTS